MPQRARRRRGRVARRGRRRGFPRWLLRLGGALALGGGLSFFLWWALPWLLEALGLGLALVALVLAIDVWVLAQRPRLSMGVWRWWGAVHLAAVVALGVLGQVRPSLAWRGVSWEEVSFGGKVGEFLSAEPWGVAALVLLAVLAVVLSWPPLARVLWLGRHSVWAFGRGWEALRHLLMGRQPVAPLDEPPPASQRRDETPPFLAHWDEEWPAPAAGETEEAVVLAAPLKDGWELPPMDLLERSPEEGRPPDNEARARLIVETLRSFGVDAKVVSIQQGPTVTQFGIEPGWEVKTRQVPERDEKGRIVGYRTEVVSRTRVRVNRITALANDLALALAAPSIRIEAPVPGRPIIGIEVPNVSPSVVSLRSVMESQAFQRVAARSRLALALGKGVSGEPVAADLAKMPHLLIAGATGSGKSVCINSIITCLLMRNTPEEVRLVLIDPKRVELTPFASVPHLVFSHVIVEVDEVPAVLAAVIREMESRYRAFASLGVRNIDGYNQSPRAQEKMPYWVVVIDELADLMLSAPYQVEKALVRLAQLARATGIHLIVATQRPSVDVVTGLIKANFPTRIAFAVSSQVDSRTILDMAGAEKLLGRGDMLYMPTDASQPRRIQGCYVSDAEIERLVKWWADERFSHLRPPPMDHLLEETAVEDVPEEDPLLEAARDLAMLHRRISPRLLQRRLNIGRERAVRLIQALERAGIVAHADDPMASRRVLVHHDEVV